MSQNEPDNRGPVMADISGYVGYGRTPPMIQWPGGARLAVAIGLNYEEGAERRPPEASDHEYVSEVVSSVPPGQRDVVIESLFEYGSRVGIWRLLEVLERHEVEATVFLAGLAAERNPDAARALVNAGLEPCGHGYRWIEYHTLTVDQQREDIQRCLASIEHVTGRRPVGYFNRYAPSPDTRALLAEEGTLLYDSNAFNDDLPYYVSMGEEAEPWLVIPNSLELNDARFWRGALMSPREFEEALIESFDLLYEEGATSAKLMSVGLHCRISGTPSRARILDRFLDHAKQRDVWFASRESIARWWLEHCPPK